MSTQAGWYPDPGGQPGRFRYWDGDRWSADLSSDPAAPAPPKSDGPRPYGPTALPAEAHPRRAAIAWWVAAGSILLAMVLLITWAVRLGTGSTVFGSGGGTAPTAQVCPPGQLDRPTPTAQPADGRVHGGKLSYPKLGAPFGPVIPELEVPFARNTVQQLVVVEPRFDGTSDWVAPVMVGDLMAGDGFFSPEDGSRIVVECVVDKFYGDSKVDRKDVRNEAATIDGHPAWVVESNLSFTVPGLTTTGELLIIAIVSTGPDSSGIFYASIPDTTPELVEPARQAMAGLRVDG